MGPSTPAGPRRGAGRAFNLLAVAILALLHERPMHPYEIAYTMRQRWLQETIKLNYGALYHTVETLGASGLIAPVETGREGRRPERTVYALTDSGRAQFRDRLAALIAKPAKEYPRFVAGLSFLNRLAADEAARLLGERADGLRREIEDQGDLHGAIRRNGVARLGLIEMEYAQAMREAELAWVERTLKEIHSGSLPWETSERRD